MTLQPPSLFWRLKALIYERDPLAKDHAGNITHTHTCPQTSCAEIHLKNVATMTLACLDVFDQAVKLRLAPLQGARNSVTGAKFDQTSQII